MNCNYHLGHNDKTHNFDNCHNLTKPNHMIIPDRKKGMSTLIQDKTKETKNNYNNQKKKKIKK